LDLIISLAVVTLIVLEDKLYYRWASSSIYCARCL
jgi:hypothetical protein